MHNLCFYSFFPACLPNFDLLVSALFCFYIVNSNSIYILFCKLNYIIYVLMKVDYKIENDNKQKLHWHVYTMIHSLQEK